MTPQRVRLTFEARVRFPDLGTRRAILLRTEADWAVLQFPGIDDQTRLPAADAVADDQPEPPT